MKELTIAWNETTFLWNGVTLMIWNETTVILDLRMFGASWGSLGTSYFQDGGKHALRRFRVKLCIFTWFIYQIVEFRWQKVTSKMYHPSRGGVRGGQDQFDWEDVKLDKHRESYLGE